MKSKLDLFQRWNIDKPLMTALLVLALVSLFVLYSASSESIGIVFAQSARLAVGFGLMLVIAQIRPETLFRWTPYLFIVGLVLLLLVLGLGAISKGAQRWLDLGITRIQPSEIMKLAVPMMVAWYFSRAELPPSLKHILAASVIIVLPTVMVALQPDLGTSIMIMAAGAFALFLAGMGWRWITMLGIIVSASLPLVWNYYMHDYQKQRVLTLFNPEADPLGAGYHTHQSMIAVGSGGLYGKGWLNGSQAHLEFLPESSTDFIFAVYGEEFGLTGIVFLFAIYLYIVGRGLVISLHAQETFTRLLAGSLTLTFFFYFFVNIGMVTGILPVVGVPLPIVSYGGSSIVTLMIAFGILMSIHAHRKLVLS